MNFSIIGSGNMAWFLAEKLTNAGHQCLGIWGRNKIIASKLASKINCTVLSSTDEIIDEENHFCIIAVSDIAITEICNQLHFQKTVVLHTSGASSIHLLSQCAKKYGVAWCIYSIVQNETTDKLDIPFAIEANNASTSELIFELMQSISQNCFEANEAQRQHLHLAAVFANNFTNHLIAIAEDICEVEKIDFKMLLPIIQQTFERIKSTKAFALQTGPAKRNDAKTMGKHIELLNQQDEWKLLYESLSASITKMYSPIEG